MPASDLVSAMLDAAEAQDSERLAALADLAEDSVPVPEGEALAPDDADAAGRVAGYMRDYVRAKMGGQQAQESLREADDTSDLPDEDNLGDVADILAAIFGEDKALQLLTARQAHESRQLQLFEAGFTGEKKDRLGRRICYQDGRRVPCQKAEKAKKAPRPSIDDARSQIRQAQANPTPRGAFDLAHTLTGLTNAELTTLKRELGVRGGGRRKDQLVQALRDRLFPEGGKAEAPRPKETPKPAPAEDQPISNPREHMARIAGLAKTIAPEKVQAVRDAVGRLGGKEDLVDLAKLRRALPDLSRDEMHAAIYNLVGKDILYGSAYEGRHGISPEQRANQIPSEGGPGTGFVKFNPYGPSAAPPRGEPELADEEKRTTGPAKQQAGPAEKPPAGPVPSSPITRDAIRQAWDNLEWMADYSGGLVAMPHLQHEIKKKLPDATNKQIQDELTKLEKQRVLDLHILNEPDMVPDADQSIRRDGRYFYYVRFRD